MIFLTVLTAMKAEELIRLANGWHFFLLVSSTNNQFSIALPERQQIAAFNQDRPISSYTVKKGSVMNGKSV